ncbi:hypothetical protein CEXT_163181 [Caerostris extrusa]|uniref:Uncharacterized protein n=1 Tax=Caerostris extrusa TaxID=172846 RepID=A0AAV4YAT4_CAEEX|nr:hypothetical protein CEXT_163181 [Caerostris extrusa]
MDLDKAVQKYQSKSTEQEEVGRKAFVSGCQAEHAAAVQSLERSKISKALRGTDFFRSHWKYPCRIRMRFLILKRKTRCQEITTTQADIKMLETQLAVAHDWNGTAKDVAQGHCQMRQYLTDMLLTQQRKKLSSLGSCS